MVDLNNLYEDVKERVERAEQQQMKRRKEVGGWIREVEAMEKEFHEILQRGDQEIQKSCLGCCPRNSEMLPRPPVDELPMEATVGPQLAYERAVDTENKSKIVLTTRSQDVCHQMKAQKSIEVECLESEDAWTLFRKEVGEEILNSHPAIPMLAKVVAEECKVYLSLLSLLGGPWR
ncbi:putative disease resistance protein [Vitis vinifera]|uniref:Putative disease resistance protein n=1 Tax=Vitis vinifera TaxID=29760 RepID=A0A438HU25_VITVI|nr:putative disease resistance protein [Vitis vinifera]RVW87945.1 putative disease resistance protein [Vitis vinifera]